MENQGNDALSNWRRELSRILFYGTANVIVSGITQGRMGRLWGKTKVFGKAAVRTKPAPASVKQPVVNEYREPDLLDHIYAGFGVLRPPRHR